MPKNLSKVDPNASDSLSKTIHVIVALCDNKYQGIVPVPSDIGNGQNPENNLYWGTAYGVKTFFKPSAEWILVEQMSIDSMILERLIFRHRTKDYFLVADAYNGKYIRTATEVFLRSSAGSQQNSLTIQNRTHGIEGNVKLLAYIGHDGLMDFQIPEKFVNTDHTERDVIILACYSKRYFQSHLEFAKVNPLVWTTGLIAPEAYTLHDALTGYVHGETNAQIQLRAVKAYHRYQKCGLNAARKLLITN